MQSANTTVPRQRSLLPVLAAACLTAYGSIAIVQLSALSDYFLFIAEYAQRSFGLRVIIQFAVTAYLYLLLAMLLYRAVITRVDPSSLPASGIARFVDGISRIVILVSPAFAFRSLLKYAAQSAESPAPIVWLAIVAIYVITACQVLLAVSTLSSRQTQGQVFDPKKRRSRQLLALASSSAAALYAFIWLDTIGTTNFVGGIGVVLLFLIVLLLGLETIVWINHRFRGLAPWLIAVIAICHVVGSSTQEFAHTTVSLPANEPKSIADIQKIAHDRGIPHLPVAFRDWIGSRINPATKKYPVFIVAAQGGGQYAAYHTALSLARLYDTCPKLKDHVFAVSSVSGGSFGAAMFTELLRQKGTLDDRCSMNSTAPGPFEMSVREFFSRDFVTPVVATGLFFDLPALLIPQLSLLPDRARTLELAYQQGVAPNGKTNESQFYSSWSPTGAAPALFFNTTSANYGRPILLSQLYMADQRPFQFFESIIGQAMRIFGGGSSGKDEQGRGESFRRLVLDGIQTNNYTRPNYFNILEYRPDLQLSVATASVLSARFPYVTPPGVLRADRFHAAVDTTLRETTDLQLIDGGFWDNSGIATANEIIRQLQSAKETKDLVGNLEFHLISFGHARAALQMEGARSAQSELFAPIMTFEAVREARRFRSPDAEAAGFHLVHNYELFDHQFQAPLSWTLSARVRREIEARSGGDVAPSLCCALPEVPIFASIAPDFILNLESMKQFLRPDYLTHPEKDGFRLVTPNLRAFRAITWLVSMASRNADPAAAK